MRKLLAVTAGFEVATGVTLLLAPSVPVSLLMGAPLETGAGSAAAG